jgi:hypothetical protein
MNPSAFNRTLLIGLLQQVNLFAQKLIAIFMLVAKQLGKLKKSSGLRRGLAVWAYTRAPLALTLSMARL